MRPAAPACGAARPVAPAARPAAPAARGAARPAHGHEAAPMPFQIYNSPDIGNPLPPFTPNHPPGIHFGRPLLRNTMTKSVEFFQLFFTPEMINNVLTDTTSYANEHVVAGTHWSYCQHDGSWKDITRDEINRLIALLMYMGLAKIGVTDKYWSTKSLYNGLWAAAIMPRIRFKALMALLQTPGDKDARLNHLLIILNLGALPCISPDNILPLKSVWSSLDTGLAYASTSQTRPPNGV